MPLLPSRAYSGFTPRARARQASTQSCQDHLSDEQQAEVDLLCEEYADIPF